MWGWPGIVAFFLLKKCHRLGIWIRQKAGKEIDAEDLPIGEYTLICSSEVQTLKGWLVYDYKSRVKGKNKTWTVLSRRPLPNDFEIVTDGRRNALRKTKKAA